jgi:hypothetical protein
MKQLLALITILLISLTNISAAGWSDYELDIGDGYSIIRSNDVDVDIGKKNGSLIEIPDMGKNVGPIVKYITTPKYIFTKNLGRKKRNAYKGDTLENVDTTKVFYFIIVKKSNNVIGPFSKKEFLKRQEVSSQSKLDWKTPANPNLFIPLIGTILFILIAIPVLLIKYYWITIPVAIGLVMLVRYIKKRRKNSDSLQSVPSELSNET